MSADRQAWLAVLARTPLEALEAALAARASVPDYTILRGPELGRVMVRGRSGGAGDAFNLGEMTVSRCSVRLTAQPDGAPLTGHGYTQGRELRKAELIAVFDALLQDAAERGPLTAALIEPQAAAQAHARAQRAAEVAATKVDFFTMPRGDG